MVSSVTSSASVSSLLLQAEASAQSSATSSSSASSSTTSGSTASSVASAALSSLASNFNQFLSLLTTQLEHQDPTDPTNTDSLTTEIAEFAGVQQQVETNTNLSSLITDVEGQELASSADTIGKTATATTSVLPLQNSSASATFTAPTAETVAIAVTDSSGNVVKTATVSASSGENTWTWDGTSNSGSQLSDGTYYIAVEGTSTDGTAEALSTSVSGTVTGFTQTSGGLDVDFGGAEVPLSDVKNLSAS